MKYLNSYKIFESPIRSGNNVITRHVRGPIQLKKNQLDSHLDTIKDMFSDITDDWNIDYEIYYHEKDQCILVDITIDRKIFNGQISNTRKFVSDIFLFAERVSSYCGLKPGYSLAGDNINDFTNIPILDKMSRGLGKIQNQGEYFQIYFTEK